MATQKEVTCRFLDAYGGNAYCFNHHKAVSLKEDCVNCQCQGCMKHKYCMTCPNNKETER